MNKIILFYKYISIAYPHQIMKWQQQICINLELVGRILISHEGINGTLAGSKSDIANYINLMSNHELFGDIDFKESDGDSTCFPRLSIKVRNEAVSLGIPCDQLTAENGGQHLTPQETHQLITNAPEDLIIFDARNMYEWEIGRFNNAVTPHIKNFRDLPKYLDDNSDMFKDKQVLMYCTGGIRCERASAYLNKKNVAKKIYQIKGGIHRYAEQYPDGFFRGKNYVFDGRIAVKITDDVLSTCTLCTKSCDDYHNCLNARCNKHFICCADCRERYNKTCSKECDILISENKTMLRPAFNKINLLYKE
ncbi:MAG TPA: rhodanese-related sulfurtransferase [Candidatus Babeliales bacterium]|nr:rhodanese-related sulfurtransferase [Candidatus Babeliales bacterium]